MVKIWKRAGKTVPFSELDQITAIQIDCGSGKRTNGGSSGKGSSAGRAATMDAQFEIVTALLRGGAGTPKYLHQKTVSSIEAAMNP